MLLRYASRGVRKAYAAGLLDWFMKSREDPVSHDTWNGGGGEHYTSTLIEDSTMENGETLGYVVVLSEKEKEILRWCEDVADALSLPNPKPPSDQDQWLYIPCHYPVD